MAKAKFGVIGSGAVGKRLATGFAKLGHPVMMGTREPTREDVMSWKKETGANAQVGTNAEAAKFGEIIVLATGWEGTHKALELAGAQNLSGKLLLDITNPLEHGTETSPPTLAVSGKDSAGESVQRWAPGAKVVKTLNMVNNAQMVDPKAFGNPTVFLAGNDAQAKKHTEDLLRAFGWTDVIDMGGIEASRMLESLTLLWIVHGYRSGKWTHAVKMMPAK